MANLPHGTVTLVFTDVEGSTQLVQRLGDGYAQVLDDHRRLFSEAVEREGGVVIDARGDEFFVVFEDAGRATEALVAAQQAFAGHDWPSGVELRVRMGLHTGEPTVRDHTYFGLDVHRAARICQAGSGGQILLSERTRDSLDSAHELADLGEHQLPGIDEPDVALIDIRMPPTQTDEGLRAAQQIRERWPDTGVLVLSQYVEPAYAMELLGENAEGVGYLLKDRVSDVDEFAAAVRRVAEGGSALDPAVVSQLVGRRRRDDPLEELTPREREVLELMAEGRSNQAIAERLVITLRAVEKHVTSIFSKLRLSSTPEDHRRVLAVLTYLRS